MTFCEPGFWVRALLPAPDLLRGYSRTSLPVLSEWEIIFARRQVYTGRYAARLCNEIWVSGEWPEALPPEQTCASLWCWRDGSRALVLRPWHLWSIGRDGCLLAYDQARECLELTRRGSILGEAARWDRWPVGCAR